MAQLKRGRVEKSQKAQKKQKVATSKIEASSVPLEKLAWQEVALPDRLDDAEGFFGLEEIDDVEVVRHEKTGAVEYRVATSNGATAPAPTTDSLAEEDGSSSEWDGFQDEVQTKHEEESGIKVQPVSAKQQKAAQKKDLKKDKQQQKVSQPQTNHKNNFDVLGESEDETVDVTAWGSLELSSSVLLALSRSKFCKPTKIQSATIPHIRDGLDVIGKASTGSGKTLAFGIPIVEHFLSVAADRPEQVQKSKERKYPPIALILSPTKELARQLGKHFEGLCSNLTEQSPRIVTLIGGMDAHKQQRLLNTADIIIGTPGRVWDFMGSMAGLVTWMRQVKFLVVDEADRLLSEGHFQEVEEILNSLEREDVEGDPDSEDEESKQLSEAKAQRQTLVFSATFEKDLQRKLAGKSKAQSTKAEQMQYLLEKLPFRSKQPKFIDVNPTAQMATKLREGLVECAASEKDLYLYAILIHHPKSRVLIFSNSIDGVKRITPLLQNLNQPAKALYGRMEQKKRLQSLEKFADATEDANGARILVATDVAARGLDVPGIELVIHYDTPRQADMYIHRSGRTARAEASGSSILLCNPDEVIPVRRLIAKIHAKSGPSNKSSGLQTLDIDRKIVARLKHRVSLAKTLADASIAKGKVSAEDKQLSDWAEELGVEYDAEEFSHEQGGKGRGKGRIKKTREAAEMSKEELGRMRAELKEDLGRRVNVGVSERYLSKGGLNIDLLLKDDGGLFLGGNGVGLDWS